MDSVERQRYFRAVPIKYKGFCTFLGPGGKSRFCNGYWNPQRKFVIAKHFFVIISLESEKEGKDISSQSSLKIAFTYRKASTFIKILKLYGKWYHENHFQYIFNNKIFATAF